MRGLEVAPEGGHATADLASLFVEPEMDGEIGGVGEEASVKVGWGRGIARSDVDGAPRLRIKVDRGDAHVSSRRKCSWVADEASATSCDADWLVLRLLEKVSPNFVELRSHRLRRPKLEHGVNHVH